MPQHILVSGQRYSFSRVHFTFFSDMTEVEQREVIKFLHTKRFNLSGIVAELALVSGEQAHAEKAVGYWVHQVKLGTTGMENEVKPGGPPLEDIDWSI
jgi:hypothetical protein